MEALWVYDANENLVPKLAESWDIPADGKTITIHVRKGIKFQDGTPLNAQAVADNFTFIKQSTANAAYAASLYKNVTSWEVLDEYTLRVNFSTFDAKFMTTLAERGMASPTAMRKPSTPDNLANDHMVGTGAFKFVSYQQNSFVKYARVDGYWQAGKPYLDNIEIDQLADPVTALISFKAGEAQLIAGIDAKDAPDLQKAGFQILKSSRPGILYLIPDGANKDSPWSNIKVRQAAEYAIDRTAISSLGGGFWQPLTQFALPSDARYIQALTPRNYDVAKAKQLLTEAGYPNGLKSTLIAGTTYNRDVLVALQTYLKNAGIDCALDVQDAAKFGLARTNGWKDGLLCVATPFLGTLQSAFTSLGPGFYPSMYRDTWQNKMDQAVAEPNYDKRMALMKDMMQILFNDAMAIPLWTSSDLTAVSNTLKGDFQWGLGHPNFYEPQNAWLSK
jgi:ABC-type transport system substrate-binding protein